MRLLADSIELSTWREAVDNFKPLGSVQMLQQVHFF